MSCCPYAIARAGAKLVLANIAYNFERLIFRERVRAAGCVCLQSANLHHNRFLAASWGQNPALQARDKAETAFTPLKATFISP